MKKYLILSLFFLSGCATNYQPKSIIGKGGFEDIELAPNYFQVVFKGNDATSEEKASDFALLRVSDLMLERDCNTFKVVKHTSNGRSGSVFLPQTQTTNTSAYGYGNSAFGNVTTTTYGGGLLRTYMPRITIEAKCSSEAVDIENGVYDTKFLNRSIKNKYKLKAD